MATVAFIRASTSLSSASFCASTGTDSDRPRPLSTNPTSSSFPHSRLPKRQATLGESWKPALKEEVDVAVARFFYHDHIAFNVARSPYFYEMARKSGSLESRPTYVPPSLESVRTTLLDREKMIVEAAYTMVTFVNNHQKVRVDSSLVMSPWQCLRQEVPMECYAEHEPTCWNGGRK
ncbi:hypothetical protein GOP47_0029349 [Adiantum capillus-veneris]|nr:hypothetical protein GOP47_0029349 [Adiantum capillus-veneris]